MKKSTKKNPTVVMISGGFDPIHIGHVRYIKEAKKLGSKLIVIINNDNWLRAKKGKEFMGELDRKEIVEAFPGVDKVYITEHKAGMNYDDPIERSVCDALRKIQPHIFANGGDRKPSGYPVPEVAVCKELGIKMVYNVGHGGKVRSSSELTKEYSKHLKKHDNKKI
ncbi:MAG: adenylyltransferase/cytidyltransferase family protein [Candidatus Nomurabacteria bacterium]|nr:adenylyltransferase/cytidyltransferase family protein [Candidatus Nomurabacteria bacterium]